MIRGEGPQKRHVPAKKAEQDLRQHVDEGVVGPARVDEAQQRVEEDAARADAEDDEHFPEVDGHRGATLEHDAREHHVFEDVFGYGGEDAEAADVVVAAAEGGVGEGAAGAVAGEAEEEGGVAEEEEDDEVDDCDAG